MDSSSSVMAPFFANQSCDPFQPRERPCTLGNYVVYAVDARTPGDIQAAIIFAKKYNIRFVVRNTGHDYNGRSTGAGAISVWVHNMKGAKVVDWADKNYQGKAVTVAAGVQGFEVMDAANAAGLAVVGGECPTVSLAGGYTQGGGHSALSTGFGLSADNVLEWELVTADAKVVKASRTVNADLYWAHPDAVFGGATVAFFAAENDATAFYKAIDAFHEELAAMVDPDTMVVYYFAAAFFQIAPINAYNKTEAELTPGGGVCQNEADFRQPRWQQEFFGANYNNLLCIKKERDPEGFFYALNGVGSEAWTVASNGPY
ncbi:hypothetical protein VDGE_10402 [Verticillium dahliae]|uniref:FAD-binding PCMH-type domain-containing protein n=1 Tax=Verticillium dahliae TaxID=27337 RepID=A0A444RVN5_VERDA|nr:hypothetical protein VDGE_10402 [Verticillium dahliae]